MASNQGKYLNFCLIAMNNEHHILTKVSLLHGMYGEFDEWETRQL